MARGWTTKEGGPVINVDLIKLIHFMISKREGPVEVTLGTTSICPSHQF